MALSLKDQNKLPLLGVAIGNLAVLLLLIRGGSFEIAIWASIVTVLRDAIPVGVGLILIGIVNAQLSPDLKARIVFGKWKHPLPGAEAFSRHAKQDDRVDVAALERFFGPLPTDARDQSALWYRLYQTVREEPSVRQVHREYLFTRDYTCLSLMLILTFGPIAWVEIVSASTAAAYGGLLLVQFTLANRAARMHGRRFVTTVLALKAAGR